MLQVLRWLKLPQNCPLLPPLKQAYSAAAQQSLFAIRDKDGHLIEASMWCRSGVICCEARAGIVKSSGAAGFEPSGANGRLLAILRVGKIQSMSRCCA